ncbi:DUF3016 domain-containing protein [Planctobacterium marinum]|uniref:DUF3016 domain-containing protein n=1 Tax=Planctobacterium marinum TaxID=1631968 RepID=A0AA48HYL2_9ALTE|nr:hypothetical protein MACH26_37540 [Planctobacterium marinum]
MKKFLLATITTALFISTNSHADEQENLDRVDESERVAVTWVNPKEYTDVKPANGIRSRFRNRTLETLHEYMDELAADLPEGQKLTFNVTDLDLAGRVWPGSFVGFDTTGDVRLIKRVEIPRMDFSYELLDSDGSVLKSGTEELKDMAFMDGISTARRDDPLKYEKNMLRDWFRKEFKQELLASN